MSLENSIEDMAQVLKRKAPKLRPLVVPRLCLLGKGSGFGADSATARSRRCQFASSTSVRAP